jgi:single-stranded-DNA-specific exonuclease
MGEQERHARFSLQSGPRRALGVAFGVNGELDTAARAGPLDLSVNLELNEWNGAVEPRVVLATIYAPEAAESAGVAQPLPGAEPQVESDNRTELAPRGGSGNEALGAEEFWQRFDAELTRPVEPWPDAALQEALATAPERRERIDRHGSSVIAAIAGLASAGEPVFVVCADALRRRALIEGAVRPARFGGGEIGLASARLPEAAVNAAVNHVLDAGGGAVLSDWPALERRPALGIRFPHVILVDPAPFRHLDQLAAIGEGFVHDLAGPAEAEFALRVLADEWPSRASLGELYRGLRDACAATTLAGEEIGRLLAGPNRSHPRTPEVCARLVRVLDELGLLRWGGFGAGRTLGVVSSEATDLERSKAFVAYRDRFEEARRYLSRRRQS